MEAIFTADEKMNALMFNEEQIDEEKSLLEALLETSKITEEDSSEIKEFKQRQLLTMKSVKKEKSKEDPRANRKIYALIIGSVDAKVHKYFDGVGRGEGKDLWNRLLKQYESDSRDSRRGYFSNLTGLKLEQNEDMAGFLHRFKTIVQKIEQSAPIVQCENCQNAKKVPIDEDFLVAGMIHAIKDHGRFRTARDLVLLDSTKSLQDFEEMLLTKDREPKTEPKQNQSLYTPSSQVKCFVCDKTNHIKRDCKYKCRHCHRVGSHHESNPQTGRQMGRHKKREKEKGKPRRTITPHRMVSLCWL
jgi:hypothetical protein